MSELAELLAEFREIREVLAPRRSYPIIVTTGNPQAGGTGADSKAGAAIASIQSTSYVTILKWLPTDPGGILKQIFLAGNALGLYRIVVEHKTVIDELLVASSGAASQSDFVLDFKRKRLGYSGKAGVQILGRSTTGSTVALQAVIHGEQVEEW